MYAKVFAQIYDGTLCTKGPWQALVTFQQLLVLADQDGHVDMTAAAISRRTTIPLEIISLGIEELLKDDPESRTPTENGRRILPLCEGRNWGWAIVNYKHYRALKREEERRNYHREYWHKRKDKLNTKLNNSTKSTEHNTLNQNQPIAEAEAEAKAKEVKPFVSHEKIVFDGTSFKNINGQLEVWKTAYPAIDVTSELNKIAAWVVANPKNVKKQWGRFINGWLSRAQDKAPKVGRDEGDIL